MMGCSMTIPRSEKICIERRHTYFPGAPAPVKAGAGAYTEKGLNTYYGARIEFLEFRSNAAYHTGTLFSLSRHLIAQMPWPREDGAYYTAI
jgi:hypothetical protein